MEQGVGPALSRLIRQRQSFVDPAQGAVRVLPLGLELGEQTLEERRMDLVSLVGVRGKCFPKSRHPAFTVAEPGASPF